MIRVVLPAHLKTLAQVHGEVEVEIVGTATPRAVIDELEIRYPVLLGTIRDPRTQERRKFIRFYACEEDLSLEGLDVTLPDAVAKGSEPFFVIGAMAGG
jgi:molybdopterin synthase sulfur carrier subunit